VVKIALKHLGSYLNEERVKRNIESLKANHPSPKIQSLAQSVIESDVQFQYIQELVPKWGRYIIETLPGLESFVTKEATLQGIPLQKGVVGDGWIELTQVNIDIEKLRSLHTIIRVHGIVSVCKEENDEITFNPYVESHNLYRFANRLKKIKIRSTSFETVSILTEKEMIRPTRRLRSTSLDWRVARAMVLCSNPSDNDVFLDPTCGSGTLLLDRAAFGSYHSLKGGDLDEETVETAIDNLRGYKNVDLKSWNAAALPLQDGSVSVVVSNLPFGRRVGDHESNVILYPQFIKEVNRVLKVGGRAVLLTQEVKLLHHAAALYKNNFTLEMDQPVEMGGLTPHIMLLKKK
jgi:tRNA G10  N-methylase Trm11